MTQSAFGVIFLFILTLQEFSYDLSELYLALCLPRKHQGPLLKRMVKIQL